jgi:hypothetical protein
MDMLSAKLNLLRDLSHEHQASVEALASVRNGLEGVIDKVER